MHNTVQSYKTNAEVCINSLEDVNIVHCVEFTFLKGSISKLDLYVIFTFLEIYIYILKRTVIAF